MHSMAARFFSHTGGDVEEGVGLPAHLLGLVRLEEVELGRAKHLLSGVVAPGLRDHAGLERNGGRVHVVGVVGVVGRMAQHEGRLHRPDHVHEPVLRGAVEVERIVAEVEEPDVVDAERLRRALGLGPAGGLHTLQRHAGLLPELRAFAPFAVGEADDGDVHALLLMQRDGAAAAPDEVGGVGGDDEGGSGHGRSCGGGGASAMSAAWVASTIWRIASAWSAPVVAPPTGGRCGRG
jgi:hypothetical protein